MSNNEPYYENDSEYSEPELYHTQGGGTVQYNAAIKWYVFVEPPSWSNYKPGDIMPREWGIA